MADSTDGGWAGSKRLDTSMTASCQGIYIYLYIGLPSQNTLAGGKNCL